MNKILYAILLPYIFCIKCGCYDLVMEYENICWKTWTLQLRLVWVKLLNNYSYNKNANRQFTDSVSWQSYTIYQQNVSITALQYQMTDVCLNSTVNKQKLCFLFKYYLNIILWFLKKYLTESYKVKYSTLLLL